MSDRDLFEDCPFSVTQPDLSLEQVMAHFQGCDTCDGLYRQEHQHYLKGEVPFLFADGPVRENLWIQTVKEGMDFEAFMVFALDFSRKANALIEVVHDAGTHILARPDVRFRLETVLHQQYSLVRFKSTGVNQDLVKQNLAVLHRNYRRLRELMGLGVFSEMFGLLSSSEVTFEEFLNSWTVALGFDPTEIQKLQG